MQSEEQLMRTEKQMKIANAFRNVAKEGLLEITTNLQQLQIQLQRVVEEKESIQAELSAKEKMYDGLYELKEQYNKKWRKSADKVQLLEALTEEKEQEVKKLKGKLQQKERELHVLNQCLNHLQEEMSQKTEELEQESNKVLELEKEVKKLQLKLRNKETVKDMQLQQMTAKTISQDAYIGEIKVQDTCNKYQVYCKMHVTHFLDHNSFIENIPVMYPANYYISILIIHSGFLNSIASLRIILVCCSASSFLYDWRTINNGGTSSNLQKHDEWKRRENRTALSGTRFSKYSDEGTDGTTEGRGCCCSLCNCSTKPNNS